MPLFKDTILRFINSNPRNPYPVNLSWQTCNTDFGRNNWVIIKKLINNENLSEKDYPLIKPLGKKDNTFSGVIEISINNNTISVSCKNIKEYILLISPEQFSFSKEVIVYTNNSISYKGVVTENPEILLKWFYKDLDRTMIFGSEITVETN